MRHFEGKYFTNAKHKKSIQNSRLSNLNRDCKLYIDLFLARFKKSSADHFARKFCFVYFAVDENQRMLIYLIWEIKLCQNIMAFEPLIYYPLYLATMIFNVIHMIVMKRHDVRACMCSVTSCKHWEFFVIYKFFHRRLRRRRPFWSGREILAHRGRFNQLYLGDNTRVWSQSGTETQS